MLTMVIALLSSLIAMAGVELQVPARHPTGLISGRVVDDEGRPMRRVEVQALVYEIDGPQRTLVSRGKSAATNDRGEFRLFWLDPGTYYIGIREPEPRTAPFVGGDNLGYVPSDPDASFVTTYFPGTAYAAEAKPIQIDSGEIDIHAIQMVVRTTRRIRGTIVNSKLSAKSFGTLAIALYRQSDPEWPLLKKVNAPQTGPDFEIRGGIDSGSYRVAVLWRGISDVYAGTSIVTIGQTDPDLVEVPVSETISIVGNVQAGNGTIPDSLYVVIVPDGPNTPGISLGSTVKASGRFAFEDVVPGRYRLHLRGLPENTYVAGVRIGRREFTPDAVDFMPEATSVSIVIKQK